MSSSCSPEYASGFKLFGVQIDLAESNSSIRKSKSLGNILEATLNVNNDRDSEIIKKSRSLDNLQTYNNIDASGYVSDYGLRYQSSKGHDIRKRGKPWTEEEHRSFLMGLEKLGRGDWKGISSKFVPSRNSTQVASHAQKYFMRLANKEKKRRRSSVFDIPLINNKHKEPIRAIQVSSSNTSPEVRNLAASTKNDGEMKGKTILASSEKPPLSPMKRNIISEFHSPTTYASRLSSFNQGFASQGGTKPTLSWVPVINFSGRNSFLVTNFHGGLANCGAFVPQSSVGFQKTQHIGSSQVRSGAETPHSDDLNCNIRKLTL